MRVESSGASGVTSEGVQGAASVKANSQHTDFSSTILTRSSTHLCQFTSLNARLQHTFLQTRATDFCELSQARPTVANGFAKVGYLD